MIWIEGYLGKGICGKQLKDNILIYYITEMTIYFHKNLRLCKEKFTKSIFKFNSNYYEHAPIELVKAFIKNKQGVSLKSNRVLGKAYDN